MYALIFILIIYIYIYINIFIYIYTLYYILYIIKLSLYKSVSLVTVASILLLLIETVFIFFQPGVLKIYAV